MEDPVGRSSGTRRQGVQEYRHPLPESGAGGDRRRADLHRNEGSQGARVRRRERKSALGKRTGCGAGGHSSGLRDRREAIHRFLRCRTGGIDGGGTSPHPRRVRRTGFAGRLATMKKGREPGWPTPQGTASSGAGKSCPQPAFSRLDPLESGSAAWIGCPTSDPLLERDSQTETELSAGGRAGDAHEVLQRIRDGLVQTSVGVQPQAGGTGVGRAPDGRVGEVGGFGAKLGRDLLLDLEVLEDGRAELPVAGTSEYVAARAAEPVNRVPARREGEQRIAEAHGVIVWVVRTLATELNHRGDLVRRLAVAGSLER